MCGIVPVDGESVEEGTRPVHGYSVEFLEGLDDVVGILLSNVLDTKVVNEEGEKYGLGIVPPQ